jgi:hypothetical protein
MLVPEVTLVQMWLRRPKKLMQLYGEKKLYVTDLQTGSRNLPRRIYVFLDEFGTEIELEVAAIRFRTRRRSDDSVIFMIELEGGERILLKLDTGRGNHFVYCHGSAYEEMLRRYSLPDSQIAPSVDNGSHGDVSHAGCLEGRILLIDTLLLPRMLASIPSLLAKNEIMLSPYYDHELRTHLADHHRCEAIRNEIDSLARSSGGKLIADQYIVAENEYGNMPDLSTDRDYLLLLAQQLQVTASHIVFLTEDEAWMSTVRRLGFSAMLASEALSLAPAADVHAAEPVQADKPPFIADRPADGGLPPRASRLVQDRMKPSRRTLLGLIDDLFAR